LMRASREFRNSADDATAALQGLADSGEGSWIMSNPSPKGGQPRKVFRLTMGGDGDTTPAHNPTSVGSVTVTTVTDPENDDWEEV